MASMTLSKAYDSFTVNIHGCDKEDLQKFEDIGGNKTTHSGTATTFHAVDLRLGKVLITLFSEVNPVKEEDNESKHSD